MDKQVVFKADIDFWSRELTEEEKKNLDLMVFDDKDLCTDFDWLHFDNYVENNNKQGKEHQIAFYNNNCLWQLNYTYGCGGMSLQCVYSPNEQVYNESYEAMKDLLCECSVDEDYPVVHTIYKKKERLFLVEHFAIDID